MDQTLRLQAHTCSVTFVVGETPTDSTTDVVVTVTHENGTILEDATAATAGPEGSGTYTWVLPGQSNLDVFSLDWLATIDGQPMTESTDLEVVGGVYAPTAQIRNLDGPSGTFQDAAKFPLADILEAERDAQDLFEGYCDIAFVPRYARAVLDGNGSQEMFLPSLDVRRLIDATEDGAPVDTSSWIIDEDGRLFRPNDRFSAAGPSNLVIRYEHGKRTTPSDIRRAYVKYVRALLLDRFDRIDDRSTSLTAANETIQLAVAGPNRPTGYPDVDSVLNQWRATKVGAVGGWGVGY